MDAKRNWLKSGRRNAPLRHAPVVSPSERKHEPSGLTSLLTTRFPARLPGQITKRTLERKPVGGGGRSREWGRGGVLPKAPRCTIAFFYDHHQVHLNVLPSVKSLVTTQRETGWKPQRESQKGFREQELAIREQYYTLVFLGFRKCGLTDSIASSVQ